MMVEGAHFFLIMATALMACLVCASCIQWRWQLWGATQWVSGVRSSIYTYAACLTLAYAGLTYAFAQHDYSVRYVWQNSHDLLPLGYRLTAVWGSHEGSWLLWLWLLGMMLAVWVAYCRAWELVWQQLMVTGAAFIALYFSVYALLWANPFLRLWPIPPAQGLDLNPLLQDVFFLIHPPCLYMGSMSFLVPYVWACQALWSHTCFWQDAWLRQVRVWSLWGWSWLTMGMALGSYWAYRELGWGGWWFWDPVENTILMPWLVATGLIHIGRGKLSAQRRLWVALMAVSVFVLVFLGTFVVRSGLLISVHAFAESSDKGWALGLGLLWLIGMPLFGWLKLWYERGFSSLSMSPNEYRIERWWRYQNLLFMMMMWVVLVGTLYPWFSEWFFKETISVGGAYFESVLFPFWCLMMFGLIAHQWPRGISRAYSFRVLLFSLCSACIGMIWWCNNQPWLILTKYVLVATSSILVCFVLLYSAIYASGLLNIAKTLAHGCIGLAVLVMGLNKLGSDHVSVSIEPGATKWVGDTQYRFDGVSQVHEANYQSYRAQLRLKSGNHQHVIYPEIRYFASRKQYQSKAWIESGRWYDDYTVLSEPVEGQYMLRLYRKPFQTIIWCLMALCALSGFMAWARSEKL
ncbi:MAG: cytochrome c-type biogenesis CcmF C-terminal domain-containing protein [Pseudomonadota bacterium]|nr:cytochrome c-type biogenesis CcmF C-terminal domain-containing protein [Pseudomonadota bacterium]